MLDIYKTMTMEQIIDKVDSIVKKGKNNKLYPFHYITYIEGRATYKDYEATVVVTRSCRFIEHSKTKIFKFEEGVRNATTPAEIEDLKKQYDAFDVNHRIRISDNVVAIFNDKKAKVEAGIEIGIPEKRKISAATEMEREKPRFYLTACKNGNVILQVHDTFKKVFKKGCYRVSEYEQPKIQYFLAKDGIVKEVFGTSDEAKKVLAEIRETVHAAKSGKKSSSKSEPTQVRSISISKILEIK